MHSYYNFYLEATLVVVEIFVVVIEVSQVVTDNTNVESRSRSVVKYVINNIMSTALTGQKKMATYLHLVRELLYKIEWPSVRRLHIGILCTYWHVVRALPIFCD